MMFVKRWLKFLKRFIIIACLLITSRTLAAPTPELRHIRGFQGIGLSAGTSLEAPCFSLDYTVHLARTWHLQFGLGYATGQKGHLAMDQIGLQALLAHTLWSYQS